MTDPFKAGFKGFFGVIAGCGLLILVPYLTINIIQIISSEYQNFSEEMAEKKQKIKYEKTKKRSLKIVKKICSSRFKNLKPDSIEMKNCLFDNHYKYFKK